MNRKYKNDIYNPNPDERVTGVWSRAGESMFGLWRLKWASYASDLLIVW